MNASHQSGGADDRRTQEVPVNGTPDKSQQTTQSPAEIEAEIEQKREDLAETLDALGAKLDVKAQTRAKVQEVRTTTQVKAAHTKDLATTDDGKPRPELLGAAAVLLASTIALIWWKRSR